MGIKSLAAVTDGEQPLKYRYEAIIDYMLSNPSMKLGEIAELIGCTQAWLSQIVNADGFQARYAQRRHSLNQEQERNLSDKIYRMADAASERVLQELDKGEECDASFALEAATRSLRAIGFGAPPSKGSLSVQEQGAAPNDGLGAETLRVARQAIAHQSMVLTRVTESVQVSTSEGTNGSRVFEGSAHVEADIEVERKAQEGSGL